MSYIYAPHTHLAHVCVIFIIIIKEIKESTQQLISFKDEIVRLFYLADAMEFTNTVTLELSEGRNKKKYKISGFSHMLDVAEQQESRVSL